MTNFESVRKFMETFGQEIKKKAEFPNILSRRAILAREGASSCFTKTQPPPPGGVLMLQPADLMAISCCRGLPGCSSCRSSCRSSVAAALLLPAEKASPRMNR